MSRDWFTAPSQSLPLGSRGQAPPLRCIAVVAGFIPTSGPRFFGRFLFAMAQGLGSLPQNDKRGYVKQIVGATF